MRNLYILLVLLIWIITGCTSSPEKVMEKRISSISTYSEASDFLNKNKDVDGYTIDIDSTESYFPSIQSLKPGEVFMYQSDEFPDEIRLIKFLHSRRDTMNQVNAMNLDGDSLKYSQVDSLRTVILQKLEAGEKFEDLAETYSNARLVRSDKLYSAQIGIHMPEWENGVRDHAPGEVFTITQPEHKLHFIIQVVKKSYLQEIITVMVVNVKNPSEK